MFLCEADPGVFPTLVLGVPHGLVQEFFAYPPPSVRGGGRPRTYDAHAALETGTSTAVPALAGRRGRGASGLEPQNECPDEDLAGLCAENNVHSVLLFPATAVSTQPVPVDLVRQSGIVGRQEADGGKVEHRQTACQQERAAGVPLRAVGVGEAIHGGPGGDQVGEAERMREDGSGGARAHLGHRVGHEPKALGFVMLACKGVEGQRRDVVEGHQRFGDDGRGAWRRLCLRWSRRMRLQTRRVVVGCKNGRR